MNEEMTPPSDISRPEHTLGKTVGHGIDATVAAGRRMAAMSAQKISDAKQARTARIEPEKASAAAGTEQTSQATALPPFPSAFRISPSRLLWAYWACLALLLITPFFPWFSISAAEGWGEKADHAGLSSGLAILILLPVLAAIVSSLLVSLIPQAGLASVAAAVLAFLAVLLGLAAGRPSLREFGPAADMIQVQLIWGAWISLLLVVAAMTIGGILNFNAIKKFAVSRRAAALLIIASTLLIVAGCGSKISQSNYDKVENGMSQEQVQSILGDGREQASSAVSVPGRSSGGVSVPGLSTSAKVLSWQDGPKVITVTFMDGKVMGKAQSGL